jgi:hypothetical protein
MAIPIAVSKALGPAIALGLGLLIWIIIIWTAWTMCN